MKRAASVEVSPTKKTKLYHDIFEDSQQRSPGDILESGLEDDSGYIACKCFMTWRPTTKHKAIIETTESTERFRFDVEFAGACVDFFSEIELKAQDEFLLALRSAQIEKNKPSRLCNISLRLVYEEGVIIKFLKRQGPCRVVDTWQLKEDARRHEDAWFLPPQDPLNSLVMNNKQSMDVSSLLETVRCDTLPTGSSTPASENPSTSSTIMSLDNDKATPKEISLKAAQEPKLSKRQKKELYKQKRALMLASTHAKDVTMATVPDSHSKPVTVSASVHQTTVSTIPSQAVSHLDPSHLHPAPPITPSYEQTKSVVLPRTTAGLIAATGRYHQLADLNDLVAHTLFNAIGVVIQVSPPRIARSGEWYCSVKLADPSNNENLNGLHGFRFNCFTRKYEQWLPYPSLGEVLVMRDVRISDYQEGKMGVGYHGRLQWAIFSPSTGKIRHGDLGNAPEYESVASEGHGYPFSPFFKPEEAEIRYCLKMADWWAEVEKHRKSIGEVHQVCGPSDAISISRRPQREHRLISEAGPKAPPDGYFDCTVEVLHGHLNDNGVYSLYVTDYTVNTAVSPIEASWCSPDLADYVLKIEAWDGAAEVTKGMFAGEYYSIKNARMKVSHGGYVEGKVVEKKIKKLNVGEDGDVNPYFKALLERKRAWEQARQSDNQSDGFVYETIGEAVEGKHFHCVVEVLHAIHDDHDTSCIYVTDYTSRNELVSGRVQQTWGAGLDGSVLRIALYNNQAEMAKTIQVGSFYDIKKLRLRQSALARQIQGQLGGVERLISLLDPNKSSDDRLTALKQRKEEWQKRSKTIDAPITANISPPIKIQPDQDSALPQRRGITIAELKVVEKCPSKDRVFARVVDFRPWKLSDAVIIHCTHCRKDLPPLQKACFNCDDTDHEYVQFMFQMYLLLEDVAGDQVYVSVHDGSTIFDGLKRVNVSEDPIAYRTLLNRLSTLLGNLLDLHSGPIPKEGTEILLPNTPILPLIIDTWEADGKHAYCLAGCDELQNA